MTVSIANRPIGRDYPPFILAELSANHNGSLERALKLIDAAADSGVDGVKLQTYTASGMTLDLAEGEFTIRDPNTPWQGERLYSLYEKASTPWEWHAALFQRAKERGLIAFSSPFSLDAVDFLEGFDVPAYKIASFELVHLPLIRKAASTGKPLVLSTGMATEQEIQEAITAAKEAGAKELILLKCSSSQPSPVSDTHLRAIPLLEERFHLPVGLSDHTIEPAVGIASVALGCCFIEVHLTLKRADGGPDASFSLEPHEIARLKRETVLAHQALGEAHFGPTESERRSFIAFRRSLYVAEDVLPGDPITATNLRAVRPGHGLSPKYLEELLGKRFGQEVKKGTPMSWDLLCER